MSGWDEINNRGWSVGGLYSFLRPSAESGEILPEQRQALDAFIRTLPTFLKYDEEKGAYFFDHPSYPSALMFTSFGLFIETDGLSSEGGADLDSLLVFARTLGLLEYFDEDDGTFAADEPD